MRFEYADGNFTLVPRQGNVTNYITSAPVVMGKRKCVAYGSNYRVVGVKLDDQGRFLRESVQATVPSPRIEALAYSDKFDRLYVPVETGK
jgi:hypothetical protein